MRLIDADELMELLRLRKDSGIGTEIDEIKTVQAIPIEYIEKFKKEFRAVASVKAVIEWLLEDWSKENEQSNTSK